MMGFCHVHAWQTVNQTVTLQNVAVIALYVATMFTLKYGQQFVGKFY